mmetsp:Transcript_7335/g.22980  ORF Transcript_7335/g.22980 Transcript_7335/m.22980 type:complete len:295 (-) Transcript_7335:214-1098(-)
MGLIWQTVVGSALLALVVTYVYTLLGSDGASEAYGALGNAAYRLLRARHIAVKTLGRTALVYAPRPWRLHEKVPAIFVLHGSFSSPKSMYNVGFEPLADQHGFLVVYPEMRVPQSASWGYTDDIPYMTALVRHLCEDFDLDPEMVFVCGHSAGGTMALFLQNEVDLFRAAAAVEAGVGHLHEWSMNRTGRRTMLIWNHADPVLAEYGGEELYRQTIATVRRNGSTVPSSIEPMPTSTRVVSAELRRYPRDGAPEFSELSWKSSPGTHEWPQRPTMTFDAAQQLASFFLSPATSS